MEGSVEKTWWNASNAAGAVVEGEKVWAANKQVRRKRNWTTGEQFFSWQFRWISTFLSQHLSPHQDARSGNQVHNICTQRGMWVIPLANSIDFCRNLFFCVVLKNTAKNRQSQISCKTGGYKFYRFIKRSLNQTLSPPPLLFHSLKGWQVVMLLLPQQTSSTNDFPSPLFTSLPASRCRFVATDVQWSQFQFEPWSLLSASANHRSLRRPRLPHRAAATP